MPDGINNVDSTILKLAEQYQSCNVRSRELNEERATIRANVDKLGIDPKAFQVALAMTRDMTPGERQDYTGSMNRVLGVLDGKEADLFGAEDMRKRDERAKKRADKKARDSETPEQQERRLAADTARGNPDKGGASGKVDGRGKAKDAAPKPVEPAVTGRLGRAKGAKADGNVVSLKDHAKKSDAALAESIAAIGAGNTAELPDPPGSEQQDGGELLDQMLESTKARAAAETGADSSVDNLGDKRSQSEIAAERREAAGVDR